MTTCSKCKFFSLQAETYGVCRALPTYASHHVNDWCGLFTDQQPVITTAKPRGRPTAHKPSYKLDARAIDAKTAPSASTPFRLYQMPRDMRIAAQKASMHPVPVNMGRDQTWNYRLGSD